MASKNKFYVYFIAGGPKGVTADWKECEKIVKGVNGARFKGFQSRKDANDWLISGANYVSKTRTKTKIKTEISPGIYFDAGTGRGNGVEISVTDENGKDLLHHALSKKEINPFGKHYVSNPSATNNYGELLALKYALKIAEKEKVLDVFGDSRLIIEYWSRWRIKRDSVAEETVKLSKEVSELRDEFERTGGSVKWVSGDYNPADLGFHR